MITFLSDMSREISQASYQEDLDRLPLERMRCSSCGHVGQLTCHAYYTREVKTRGDQIPITIRRLKCAHCSHTHAVVPASIVPYCQATLWDQIEILRRYSQGLTFLPALERNPAIDENLSYAILRKYREHWQADLPPDSVSLVPVEEIPDRCFSMYNKQFLQVRGIPNTFFSEPT